MQGWFYDLASNLMQVKSKILTRFGDGGSILVIWSRFSKSDKSGAGGAPMIGFAITVYPRGIGLAIKIFDLLSSDGNGPGIG